MGLGSLHNWGDEMNTYLIAKTYLLDCGVKIEGESDDYIYVINSHGVRDTIINNESGIMDYIFAD